MFELVSAEKLSVFTTKVWLESWQEWLLINLIKYHAVLTFNGEPSEPDGDTGPGFKVRLFQAHKIFTPQLKMI